jgi:5-formyltetrahydrofolate cyclo-ligase
VDDRTPLLSDKRELRLWMRRVRRDLPDRPRRSEQIWQHVVAMTDIHRAQRILVFTTIPGEPEVGPFVAWCDADGKETAVPEDGVDPSWPDVVLVPGLAFTRAGARLGQGGGWYDRFLPLTRPQCTMIGVGFREQLVESVPIEPHDVHLHAVVTDAGPVVVERSGV